MLLDVVGKGFMVGATVNSCTKGLWIWDKPLKCKMADGTVVNLLIIDTEGIGSLDADADHDAKIFALALLLSSYFIYNSVRSSPPPCSPLLSRPFLSSLSISGGIPGFSCASLFAHPLVLSLAVQQRDLIPIYPTPRHLREGLFPSPIAHSLLLQVGSIDESALNNLSLVVELTKHIRTKAGGGAETGENFSQFFPHFL